MMHNEEAAGTCFPKCAATAKMEIKPENFRPQYKVHKIFMVSGKS